MNKYRNFVLEPKYTFKILMIGDESIGKSSILQQYVENTFFNKYTSTIGIDFNIKYTNVNDNNIKLQIWDTAGQERFKSLTTSYYRLVNGIVLVYDISNRKSFENIDKWINDINDYANPESYVILVGNKADSNNREVSTEEGIDKANELNISFIETSAKTNMNIDKCFEILIEKLLFVIPEKSINKIILNKNEENNNYIFTKWC
jgi:small GTP-binding protein